MIENYEYITIPGLSGITIPIVNRKGELLEPEGTSRTPDWGLSIAEAGTESTFDPKSIELFGWYCKSSNFVKEDCVNNFYKSGTLWHSDVFLVVQNGKLNAYASSSIANGVITTQIQIFRYIKSKGTPAISQTLTFGTCEWCGSYSYLEHSILRFTACQRENKCEGYTQKGDSAGSNSCIVDYSLNAASGK